MGVGRSLHSFDIHCSKIDHQLEKKSYIRQNARLVVQMFYQGLVCVNLPHFIKHVTQHSFLYLLSFHCPCPLWLYVLWSKPPAEVLASARTKLANWSQLKTARFILQVKADLFIF